MIEQRITEHDEVWDLLPWYATGTLGPEEARRVEAHLATCDACAGELALEKRLAGVVADLDPAEDMEARGWEAMREKVAPATGNVIRWPGIARLRGAVSVPVPVLGGALAACLALFVAAYVLLRPPAPAGDGLFETMTSDPPAVSSSVIRIKVAEDVSEGALRALLVDQALRIVDGPSPAGVYTLAPAEEADLAEIAARLSDAPEIDFVSVRVGR